MRGMLSSSCPTAPGTMYPTQSTSLTRHAPSPIVSSAASFGTKLGCVVIIVRPAALCGSSSVSRARSYSSVMPGITSISMNLFINVDLPVRTGPTTPMYISPPVRSAMLEYSSFLSIQGSSPSGFAYTMQKYMYLNPNKCRKCPSGYYPKGQKFAVAIIISSGIVFRFAAYVQPDRRFCKPK